MTNKPLTPIRDKKPYRDNKPCNTYGKIYYLFNINKQKEKMLTQKQLRKEPYDNRSPTVKTALEFGQVRDLFRIVDDLVQIRNNAMFNTVQDENTFNFILSELQFYHREIDYAKLHEEKKIYKYK